MQTILTHNKIEQGYRTEINSYAKIFSFKFVKSYITTMRPYLLFVSGITGLTGLSFIYNQDIFFTLILALCFFLSYGFGQALTDCFQTDTDSLSSPYRPLVKGEISKKDVMIISLSGLAVIGFIISINSIINLLLASIAVLGLATYTYFKRRWWGGPFYNSWIVCVVCLIAMLSSGKGSLDNVNTIEFSSVLASVFFGYANFVLSGYFKDISADRATGYNTLPVIFGMRFSSYISDAFAFMMIAGCGIFFYFKTILYIGALSCYFLFFAVPGLFITIYAQYLLHKTKSEDESHKPISLVVHSYILLHSAIVSLNKPSWVPALMIYYLVFNLTMKFRPMKQQI